jgi:hypothetical protein
VFLSTQPLNHVCLALNLLTKVCILLDDDTEITKSGVARSKFLISVFSASFFFFERPRSRSYGRTAALRLIVQPCYEVISACLNVQQDN